MPKFTYLFTAEDSDERLRVFRADNAPLATIGDIIEHAGELFVIKDLTHISTACSEFDIIQSLCGEIYEADAIFHKSWTATLPI